MHFVCIYETCFVIKRPTSYRCTHSFAIIYYFIVIEIWWYFIFRTHRIYSTLTLIQFSISLDNVIPHHLFYEWTNETDLISCKETQHWLSYLTSHETHYYLEVDQLHWEAPMYNCCRVVQDSNVRHPGCRYVPDSTGGS